MGAQKVENLGTEGLCKMLGGLEESGCTKLKVYLVYNHQLTIHIRTYRA